MVRCACRLVCSISGVICVLVSVTGWSEDIFERGLANATWLTAFDEECLDIPDHETTHDQFIRLHALSEISVG